MESQSTAFLAALRHFPAHGQQIELMIKENGNFSDMCEELAEVELALAKIDCVPLEDREARAAEFGSWIETLTNEIERALKQSNIIPLEFHAQKKEHRTRS